MKFTLGKEERLKSRKLIEKLYTEGNSIKKYPLRMVYLQTEHTSDFPVQVGFSVPKRHFKKAVDRNRIKRLLRESYRKEKFIVYNQTKQPHIFMISYLAKDELDYHKIANLMKELLEKFVLTINSHSNEK